MGLVDLDALDGTDGRRLGRLDDRRFNTCTMDFETRLPTGHTASDHVNQHAVPGTIYR